MLSGSVTSSASTRRCSERGSTSSRGRRIVATTFQSRSRKYRAISRPNPDEHPVIRMVFICALLSGVRGCFFDLLSARSCDANLAQTEPHSAYMRNIVPFIKQDRCERQTERPEGWV